MSLLKLTWRFLGIVAFLAMAPTVQAQGLRHKDLPFADPLEFNPDWQWFAPVDVDSLLETSARNRPNTGWFFNHDRTRLWVSRPDQGPGVQDARIGAGDWAWGHRTDVGFVREGGSGWLVNFRNLNGLGAFHKTFTERIDRFNEDEFEAQQNQEPFNPWVDANDRFLAARAYEVANSINAGRYNNFELNKTWRRSPYRYGGIMEPLIGFKYANFTDITQDQTYVRSTASVISPGTIFDETQVETLTTYNTVTLNRLLGGQIGFRYFTHYHRWRLGAEFRTFMAANWQTNTENINSVTTEYDGGPGVGTEVVADIRNSTQIWRTNQSTVWGYEVRADAAYQLTKYIGLRSGIEVLELARGIWRGGTIIRGNRDLRNQNVFMAGMTFGIEMNR